MIDHLNAGGIVMFTATPMNPKFETLVCAFDTKGIYDVKELPDGAYVKDKATQLIPDDISVVELIESFISTTIQMSEGVGGAIIDFRLSEKDAAKLN